MLAPSFQRPEQENIVGGKSNALSNVDMCCKHGAFSSSNSSSVLSSGSGTLSAHEERMLWNKISLQMALPALPPPSIPLCIMCMRVCVCTKMLNDQIHWNICGPVFSQNESGCHVMYVTVQLKVRVCVCVHFVLLQGPIVWHMVWLGFVGQKAHVPVTEATSPWLWVRVTLGRGRKKNPSPAHPAPTKMNQNWKTTCKVRLIQEHLQYADVFFCTLCLLNCLWLRASVMKLYVLVERAASPF